MSAVDNHVDEDNQYIFLFFVLFLAFKEVLSPTCLQFLSGFTSVNASLLMYEGIPSITENSFL